MKNIIVRVGSWAAVVAAVLAGPALAADQAPKSLIAMAGEGVEKRLAPSCAQVTAALSKDDKAPGIVVTIQPGADAWPGLRILPEGKEWDLSAFGHVEARVVNTGEKRQCSNVAGN
jgi:hypothetical protein